MSGRRRGELFCGLGVCAWGFLLLLAVYLQPYGESTATATTVFKLHPGFTPIETPYIIAAGLPLLAVAVGAIADSLMASRSTRLLLWIAAVTLGTEALLTYVSIFGVLLVPGFLLGLSASLLAGYPRHDTRSSVRGTA
jgi:hypothetical protein